MNIEGIVGPTVLRDGAEDTLRLSNYGAVVTSDVHGKHYESCSRGNVYVASMAASAAMGTALSTTVATIALHNPAGSGVNAAIININGAMTSAAAGVAYDALAISAVARQAAPTLTTAIQVRNAKLTAVSTGKVTAWSSATLPNTPVVIRVLSATIVTGTNYTTVPVNFDIGGAIVLPPNTQLTIQGLTTAHNGLYSFIWEEIPF